MREFVRSQNFTSTGEIMTAMKDMFRDVLQQVIECELADELGYEKSERMSNDECSNKSKYYRNGYSKKQLKPSLESLMRKFQEIEMANMNLKQPANIIVMLMVWKIKYCHFMLAE